MKLRRALATAAATAAIVPAALLAAPAAFAEESPSADPSASVTPTEQPSETTAPPSDPSPTDTPTDTKPPTAPPTTDNPTETKSPTATPSTGTPTTTPPTDKPTDEPGGDCNDDGSYNEDPDLHTTLHGLPSKVVAGSGFHTFTFQVENGSDKTYKRVDFGVFAGTADAGHPDGTGKYLTLQYKDPDTGAWKSISTDENDPGAGYVGYTDVRAHETVTVDLRLSVSAKASDGFGYAISVGVYTDDQGNCAYSTGDYYEFDVLAAGTKPGHVPPAKPNPKPQGGEKPLPTTKPQGDTKINPTGHLAETGSSSALPTIAVIGGVAMAAGAGAVFVVRRRRSGAAAA
ncbi:LAETG motif-containing sortase-dependent surface protein [Streptomyces sparsogenes]|uniref:LAETG motif-containing sortase-dependent surface protein n=1 Tax=Streptomyces sparsogenes TaxID=67365 RepID=UPI0033DD1343